MIHTYHSGNERYVITPQKARSYTLYVLEWHSSKLGIVRLTSLGTAANEGHVIPYFRKAIEGMEIHARSMGFYTPTEIA